MAGAQGHMTVRRKPKDGVNGNPGETGATVRVSAWQSGKSYTNGSSFENGTKYLDICTNKSMALITDADFKAYQCIKSHTSSSSIPLGTDGYWNSLNSFKPIVTAVILTEAIKANFIDVEDLAADSAFIAGLIANEAFIQDLVANEAFIETLTANEAVVSSFVASDAFIENLSTIEATVQNLTVALLDTAPSRSGNKIRIDGDGIILYDDDGLKKGRINNSTVGVYDGLLFVKSADYLSAGLTRKTNLSFYVPTASSNYFIGGQLFGFLNLGFCDKGTTIKLNSISMTIKPSSSNSSIILTLGSPTCVVRLCRNGVTVKEYNIVSSGTVSMGGSKTATGTQNLTYTVETDGVYTIRVTTFQNSGPVTATSTDYLSGGSGSVSIEVTTTFKFSFSKSNYEYTHIGNDGLMQVMGNGFLFSNSSEFVVRKGSYMLRVKEYVGIQKSTDGGTTWTTI